MNNQLMRVLIVDDSNIIRDKLHLMVAEVKPVQHIFLAQDFNSAMLQVKQNRPSVVLLDLNLPGKSGIEILREIKAFDKTIKVIVVSNLATEYYQIICNFLGAEFFVDKHHGFEHIPGLLHKIDRKHIN